MRSVVRVTSSSIKGPLRGYFWKRALIFDFGKANNKVCNIKKNQVCLPEKELNTAGVL